MSEHIFKIQIDGEIVRTVSSKQLKKEAPNWTGEYNVGDIIIANGEKKRIYEIIEQFPDTLEQDHISTVVLK
ncbi:hypothetical protein ACJEBK_19880 [Peribacillus frigoritolerans]|uniref:hypothetical protein n=1 Tax=Peribacillus frigoritolerans TaxID=450367 RepID=UPI00387182DC